MNQIAGGICNCLPAEQIQKQSVARSSDLFNLEYIHSWDLVGVDDSLGQRSLSEVEFRHLEYFPQASLR